MRHAVAFILIAAAASVTCRPMKGIVDPDLVPQSGFQSGTNPTGTSDCDGAVNDGESIGIPYNGQETLFTPEQKLEIG